MLIALYGVAPVLLYLGMVRVPAGPGLLTAWGLVCAALAGLWLAWALTAAPLFTGDGRQDVYPLAWVVAMTCAAALAGVARLAGNGVALKVFGAMMALLVAVPALKLFGI